MAQISTDTRKLYQQVANAIVAAIRDGRYAVGKRLPSERDLAEEYKVSRPTVREAMIALEIRGLVEARHGSGIYVTDRGDGLQAGPDLDIGAFELTEARMLFEAESAALAATTISEAELDELERLLEDMVQENLKVGEMSPAETADRQFHVTIAKATRNIAIVMVVETLWDMRYRSPLCVAMLQRARKVGVRPLVDDHRDILHALRSRDPDQAREAMRRHLGRVIESLLTATEMGVLDRRRSQVQARLADPAEG